MDELELLKKDWKKNDGQFKQVSENEIYGMLHKSSSSIVKWIFIISIVEFLVLRLMDLSLFYDENLKNKLNQTPEYRKSRASIFGYNPYQGWKTIPLESREYENLVLGIINTQSIYEIEKTVTIFNILVLLAFIFYFYKNLRNISATSSVNNLMKDIIKTRKIVKYYVWYNLIIAGITGIIVVYFQSKYDANLSVLLDKYEYLFVICCALLVLFLILVFYLFYKLLYGFLLRRLKRNYNELQKIEY